MAGFVPEQAGTLSKYRQWLTVTHVRKWHSHHHTAGTGPIYQGSGVPYGEESWQVRRADALGLQSAAGHAADCD